MVEDALGRQDGNAIVGVDGSLGPIKPNPLRQANNQQQSHSDGGSLASCQPGSSFLEQSIGVSRHRKLPPGAMGQIHEAANRRYQKHEDPAQQGNRQGLGAPNSHLGTQ